MSKSKKQLKAERKALAEARQLNPGKIIRLILKSLLFAVLVTIILVLLSLLGLPVTTNFWIQLVVMALVYSLAYPFLISEFRPKGKKDS
jgi:NADH:ubiquinone oxidoreductase subunit 2 (subunit N)